MSSGTLKNNIAKKILLARSCVLDRNYLCRINLTTNNLSNLEPKYYLQEHPQRMDHLSCMGIYSPKITSKLPGMVSS